MNSLSLKSGIIHQGVKITKSILLMSIFLGLFAVSCACTVQEQPSQEKPRGLERPIKIASKLIQDGYELFSVIEAKKPIAAHAYILAKKSGSELKIWDTESFTQIIREITSKEDALEFVRLITSQEIRPFLRDVYYSEVHKKANEADHWFAIEPTQYTAWKLHDPVVSEDNGVYKIERFVACYPRILQTKELTKAQLVKIWEWVDSDGKYLAEIQEVIAEGDAIHKILIFTK